jgi:hypothetical protein
MCTEIRLLIMGLICIYKKAVTSKKPLIDFCNLMLSQHSTPSCSALLERIYPSTRDSDLSSTFGNTMTKLRNRLDSEKAEKLANVYQF